MSELNVFLQFRMRLSNNLGNDTGNGMAVPTVCSVGTLFRIPHFLRKDVCAVSYAVQTTSRLQACHVSPAFLHVIVYNLKINLLHAWHPVQPGRRVLRTVLTCDISSDHSKHNDVSRVSNGITTGVWTPSAVYVRLCL